MSGVPALVIAGPGTNRDPDMSLALRLAGADPRTVGIVELVRDPSLLDTAAVAVVAGGFSYGDALGAGRLLALDLTVGLGDRLAAFVDDGGLDHEVGIHRLPVDPSLGGAPTPAVLHKPVKVGDLGADLKLRFAATSGGQKLPGE